MIYQDKHSKKNVLVTISTMGQFPEMFRIARTLQNTDAFNPIIYFNLGMGNHPNVIHCLNTGMDVLDYDFGFVKSHCSVVQRSAVQDSVTQESVCKARLTDRFIMALKRIVKAKAPKVFYALKKADHYIQKRVYLLGVVYRIAVKLKRIRRESLFLKSHNIKLMIFAEDSEHYYTPQLIKIGHNQNIKSVVFPYTFANQYEFLEDALLDDRRVNASLSNWLAGVFFPKWTYEYKGKKLLKSSPSFILTSEIFKVSPPNPWTMSSGFADVIAVESQFMKEYYLRAGIPNEQMIETGYPSLDNLHKIVQNRDFYKQQLAEKLNLDTKKPWVVCALPPPQWLRAGVGFKTYEQFLVEFIGFLKGFEEVEVLFKVHPRLDVLNAMKLCDEHGIKYVEDDTSDLIGLGDLYIASSSSTIRWALAMGLPTINYDMYNYNYGDFDSAKNYHVVVAFEDFKKIYNDLHKRLILSAGMNKSLVQENFASIDGQSGRRIVDLFSKLVTGV